MGVLISFLLIALPIIVRAEIAMDFMFSKDTVTQGSIVEATYRLDSVGAEAIDPLSFVGKTFEDTIHIYAIRPAAQEVELIFAKVPESNTLLSKHGTQTIRFAWAPLTIEPTEAGRGFIFGDFQIPERHHLTRWFISIGGLILVLAASFVLFRRHRRGQRNKEVKRKLRDEILGCSSYDEVVQLWTRKHQLLQQFPQLDEPLAKLESVLFKYQFKPSQDEHEKKDVMKAYERFRSDAQGGPLGV